MAVIVLGPWFTNPRGRPRKCVCGYEAKNANDLEDHMTDTAFADDPAGSHGETRN